MQWNSENMVMIAIRYLEINQISALNCPQGVDMLLNKPNQTSQLFLAICVFGYKVRDHFNIITKL